MAPNSMTSASEGPWPVIPIPVPITAYLFDDFAANIAGEMSLVHNLFIRSLNSIWHSAPLVTFKDIPALIGYTKTALVMIHDHHDSEEDIVFPVLAREGLTSVVEENVAQHRAFHEAMEAFEDYLKTVETSPKNYDSAKMRELLKQFADPLVAHLHDEIPTIQPEVLKPINKDVMDKMSKEFEAHVKSAGGFTTLMPFALTGHNLEEGPVWPPFPRVLQWLVRNVLGRVNSSWWRFAPYDLSGKPQSYNPSD